MEKKNELITNEIKNFPEFENIRNAILEAREKWQQQSILLW